MDAPIDAQERRFYDGGTTSTPPAPDQPPVIALTRVVTAGVDRFRMMRRIGYRDRVLGELLVPGDLESFETDLASVPAVFAWLVPRTGAHLPAALLHDGLVYSPGEAPSYVSTDGHDVDRVEANRVFRDACADTGTGMVRRWLMWSAVTLSTMIQGHGTRWSPVVRWYFRVVALATVAVIALLGTAATLDLFDVRIAWIPSVPWMGDQGTLAELIDGGAAAVIIPLLIALSWGPFWRAGAILGIALALLLHVTVAILGLTVFYRLVESLATRWPMLAGAIAAVVVAVSAVVFVWCVSGRH